MIIVMCFCLLFYKHEGHACLDHLIVQMLIFLILLYHGLAHLNKQQVLRKWKTKCQRPWKSLLEESGRWKMTL
jgi:uncharacterized membrane protein YkvI